MEASQKCVKSHFFREKSETFKKIIFYKSPQNDHFLFARYLFPNGNKNSATIIDFKIVTMLLEEYIYMINIFDTEKRCFHFWKHNSAPIICMKNDVITE
jgi:hypothetical protein